MKTICHVIASIDRNCGGTSTFISELLRFSMKHFSNKVYLVSSIADDIEVVHIDKRVCPLYYKKNSFFDFFSTLKRLEEKKSSIDIVHVHGIWVSPTIAAIIWAKLHRKRLILSPHGMLEKWSLNHNRVKKLIAYYLYQKICLCLVNHFHATAASEKESIKKLGFKQPVTVAPIGYEISHEIKFDAYPKRYSSKNIIFLSRINPKKGLLNLFDAWNKLKVSDWQLKIYGNDEGGYSKVLKDHIDRHGIPNVSFCGPVFGKDKEEAFNNAALFILPSLSENFGIVVPESLSTGLPVITTTGAPWEIIAAENCGWWIDPNCESILKGLNSFFEKEVEELEIMSQNSIKLVNNRFNWDNIIKIFYSMYN